MSNSVLRLPRTPPTRCRPVVGHAPVDGLSHPLGVAVPSGDHIGGVARRAHPRNVGVAQLSSAVRRQYRLATESRGDENSAAPPLFGYDAPMLLCGPLIGPGVVVHRLRRTAEEKRGEEPVAGSNCRPCCSHHQGAKANLRRKYSLTRRRQRDQPHP